MLAKAIAPAFKAASGEYNDFKPSAFDRCVDLVCVTLDVLQKNAVIRPFGNYPGHPPVAYSVASVGLAKLSRPIRPEFFVSSSADFKELAEALREYLVHGKPMPEGGVTRAVYTAVMSFSMAIDLWKPGSRKTPGTFFEMFIGSCCLLKFSDYALKKHIKMPIGISDDAETASDLKADCGPEERALSGEFVSTDLVIERLDGSRGAVIPLKITTRERIVQAFAHQTILDSAYEGRYKSFLACISEVQRDDKTASVKQVCVPGTVALFQTYLARLSGIYYCDVPQRYAKSDFSAIVPVADYSNFFSDIEAHVRG